VHAIDAGCLIFEVQQNSNTTYRVYDWGRVGPDGKPRPLHIQEALRVINWHDLASPRAQPTVVTHGCSKIERLLATSYFRIERIHLVDPCDCKSDGGTFNAFFVVSGTLQLGCAGGAETLTAGSTCLIPAAIPECPLDPVDGPVTLLRVTLP
jgi:mannose-6-phosphate isomerase